MAATFPRRVEGARGGGPPRRLSPDEKTVGSTRALQKRVGLRLEMNNAPRLCKECRFGWHGGWRSDHDIAATEDRARFDGQPEGRRGTTS